VASSSGSISSKGQLKMKAVHCVDMSGTTNPVTQHDIPGDLNAQLHCCKNLKSHIHAYCL
jgi:hypothetical protein